MPSYFHVMTRQRYRALVDRNKYHCVVAPTYTGLGAGTKSAVLLKFIPARNAAGLDVTVKSQQHSNLKGAADEITQKSGRQVGKMVPMSMWFERAPNNQV
jgi:hypothetical protein